MSMKTFIVFRMGCIITFALQVTCLDFFFYVEAEKVQGQETTYSTMAAKLDAINLKIHVMYLRKSDYLATSSVTFVSRRDPH